jgi:hypothetical protein
MATTLSRGDMSSEVLEVEQPFFMATTTHWLIGASVEK